MHTPSMQLRALVLALGVAALLVAVRGAAAGDDGIAAVPASGTSVSPIVYVGGSGYDIAVMNPDGSGRRRLTSGPADDFSPRSSPGGRSIAFLRQEGEWFAGTATSVIYLADRDGSHLRAVTDRSWWAEQPRWSPGGRWVAYQTEMGFTGTGPDGSSIDVWIVRADGSHPRLLMDARATPLALPPRRRSMVDTLGAGRRTVTRLRSSGVSGPSGTSLSSMRCRVANGRSARVLNRSRRQTDTVLPSLSRRPATAIRREGYRRHEHRRASAARARADAAESH